MNSFGSEDQSVKLLKYNEDFENQIYDILYEVYFNKFVDIY